jgi:uncharacterized membrane protein HdeD (DUF308 family)
MSALMLLQKLDPEISQTIIRSWGWYLAFGIALSLLGVAAIIRSVTATVLTMFFLGWVLVISAAIEVAQAFMVGAWVGFLVHALSAVLFGVIGLLLITSPLLAAEVATLLMAAFFLISGLFRLISSVTISLPHWNWQVALDGAIRLRARDSYPVALAGLRSLGDRAFRGYRSPSLRRCLDFVRA